jgi:hypothetical protein
VGLRAVGGEEWPVSRPSRFITGEATSGTNWIGGCVDLDTLGKGKVALVLH